MVFNSFRVKLRALLEDILGFLNPLPKDNSFNSKAKGKLKLAVKLKARCADRCCDKTKDDAKGEELKEPIRKV